MGWANRVTVARGMLALLLWGLLHLIDSAWPHEPAAWWAAFCLFVLTAATDSLDGWLARRMGDVSVFGRIADPFVDKLLVLGSMVFLLGIPGIAQVLPPWTVAVTLARELLVTVLRSAVESTGGNFQARAWGKAKMILQCVAIGGVLLHGAGVGWVRAPLFDAVPHDPLHGAWSLARLVCIASALVTIASGVDYTVRALRMLRAGARRDGAS
jgi:CDP-diacylglycerol--glycerol-3-phosphate 3-phosphatidyltransferase